MVHIYYCLERIRFKWFRLKTVLWYKNIFKKIGEHCVIYPPTVLTPDCIFLGNNVSIGFRARIEGVKTYRDEYFSPRIVLKDGVTIQQNIHLTCANYIEIGANTAIAANVSITDIDHPYTDINIPIEHQKIKTKPVIIGDDCKIYNNSVIVQGTVIGKHCTVGANSVVSGIFPDYCVIAGTPAKIVRRYSFDAEAWLKAEA